MLNFGQNSRFGLYKTQRTLLRKKKIHSEARANQIRERERERERVFNVRVLGGEELEN